MRSDVLPADLRSELLADPLPEPADPTESPEAAAAARELAALLDGALALLSPDDAATLIAYARGERPDLPAATFRKRVQRALERPRRVAKWKPKLEDSP